MRDVIVLICVNEAMPEESVTGCPEGWLVSYTPRMAQPVRCT